MWCRIALWDCFKDAMASLNGFYKVTQQKGSESVRQTFPKCNSTHNDRVFQLYNAQLSPNCPIAKFILQTCSDAENVSFI